MNLLVLSILTAVCAFGDLPLATGEGSYCYESAYKLDFKLRGDQQAYLPQPGDSGQ